MSERIQIVDKNDQIIGSATREEAWAKGLYHRTIHIIIRDDNGKVLLQKRSSQKKLYPDRWTSAVSGHVDEGETSELSASRELIEEIGIDIPLEYLGKFTFNHKDGDKIINQFNRVFQGEVSPTTAFTLEPEEVSDTKWFSQKQLANAIADNPENFTPAALETIRQFIL
jgi:isopentenyl-diphosphate delta-isomerase type 1